MLVKSSQSVCFICCAVEKYIFHWNVIDIKKSNHISWAEKKQPLNKEVCYSKTPLCLFWSLIDNKQVLFSACAHLHNGCEFPGLTLTASLKKALVEFGQEEWKIM